MFRMASWVPERISDTRMTAAAMVPIVITPISAIVSRCAARLGSSILPGSRATITTSKMNSRMGKIHHFGSRPLCGAPTCNAIADKTATAIGQRFSARVCSFTIPAVHTTGGASHGS